MTAPKLDAAGLARARRAKAVGLEPVKPWIWRGDRTNTARDSRGALFMLDGANGWVPMVGVDAATDGVLFDRLKQVFGWDVEVKLAPGVVRQVFCENAPKLFLVTSWGAEGDMALWRSCNGLPHGETPTDAILNALETRAEPYELPRS